MPRLKKKPKMTEEQKRERAEAIEVAFYAIERTGQARRFMIAIEQNLPPYPRAKELRALVQALHDRAADSLLDAFGGILNGKRYWPEKKRKRGKKP